MKFALVDSKRIQAIKGVKGVCPSCGSELIAKCGKKKTHHWAHKGVLHCDPWWENETHWHREWKSNFPIEQQEVIHYTENGEKHVADVKTKQEWVLEFQHSSLNPDECKSRDSFYPKLVWVVDGERRPTDKKQFENMVENCGPIYRIPAGSNRIITLKTPLLEISFPEECRLFTEWGDCKSLVFFDFQHNYDDLWLLLPSIRNTRRYLMQIPRLAFINFHKEDEFDKLYNDFFKPIIGFLSGSQANKPHTTVHYNPFSLLSNRELRITNKRF